jgi:hypothetical protein
MAKRLAVLAVWFVIVAVVVAATAQAGMWWMPFVAGAVAGLASRRWPRGSALPAIAGAVVGWGLPLWILALRGYPVGATARAIAGFAGLPAFAIVTVAATLLLALLQAVVGAWLARALVPGRRQVMVDLNVPRENAADR